MAADQSPNQPQPTDDGGGSSSISPAMRKRLQRCYERGKEVLRQEKPDHDYAHSMFAECVINDPGNLEYVETMLDNLQKKYKNNRRGARLRGFGGRGPFKKAIAADDWEDIFRLGLDLLRTNPWDVATLRALAATCQANHYNEVELRYLKNALDVNRKDLEVNKHCAESLARMGQFDQAIACWHRIEELDKGNEEARRKISELTLAKQRGLPGVETTAPKRKTAADTPTTAPTTTASRRSASGPSAAAARTSPTSQATPDQNRRPSVMDDAAAHDPASPSQQQDESSDESAAAQIRSLEELITRDEANLDAYINLAKAYTDAARYRDTIQILRRGLEASGGHNLAIRELLEDAQVRMVRSQVAIAEKRATHEKSSEAMDLVRRFRAELNRQELQVLTNRTDRYPQNLTLRYELGIRLKRAGNFREACRAFESAREEPALRGAATLELGECFQQLRQYGNAAKCYHAAVEGTEPATDPHKLALYRAGVLAAALKNLDAAQRYLQQLHQIDPAYRDVASRLDKVAEISDSK